MLGLSWFLRIHLSNITKHVLLSNKIISLILAGLHRYLPTPNETVNRTGHASSETSTCSRCMLWALQAVDDIKYFSCHSNVILDHALFYLHI